ncbi:GNAT family N-acetyltransferase [Actibacterium ureilyticum]|uniref:GNAT family N-acetyltransferase n=1 Tax=Actibacterium ureilyticum TaxID=1590614 RepID=UPI000BAAA36C|nr:GNAT family N-acetyltransferase [Actibacterium ureilyticum]
MDPATLYTAIAATWPPAATRRVGPWTIRDGQGGGKRVSAATADGPFDAGDLPAAEDAMRALGQDPLFMIRAGDDALDTLLADAGYRVIDPVQVRAIPVADLAQLPPPVTAFTLWQPLQITQEIWAAGGIGTERLAVMDRVTGPKTSVLGRARDRAAGAAFVAIHGEIAFCHAVEVEPTQRRQKTAVNMMRLAACWAQDRGATTLAVLVTDANDAANALYASLNMQVVGHYHYRIKAPEEA